MPGHFRRLNPAAPRQLAALWALVLAMLLAPALGRVHQVLHPPSLPGLAAHVVATGFSADPAVADTGATGDSAPGHWLLALFAGHGHKDCLLLDQLNAWAGPPAAGPSLPAALPQEPPAQVQVRIVPGGSAAYFDARAPPAAAGRVLHG